MPTPDPPPVPLSALEHHRYCPRQAGLILLEDSYRDDSNTVRGTLLHRRVHEPGDDSHGDIRILRALPVWHDDIGLTGVCDVVEIHRPSGQVTPVEHKSGSYHPGGPADVQLAGQALCLEAMFGRTVPKGQIYSAADRRRYPVEITPALRALVVDTVEQVRRIMIDQILPPAVNDPRCRRCSMRELCMPRLLSNNSAFRRAATALFTPAPEAAWDG